MTHSPDASPGFLERRGATEPGPARSSGSQSQVPRPGGERTFSRTLHLKAPAAGEPALVARSGELLAHLLRQAGAGPGRARPLLVEELVLRAGALRAAGVQLTLPLLDLPGGATISAVERLAQQLRARFGPQAARRVRLVADALLPEEQVVWDDVGCCPPPGARIALDVHLDQWNRPESIRRGQGAWEPVRTICSQWRLRTRWWMDPAHRHYYLLETARGAVLELYQELSDGSWHLVHRRD